MLTILTAHKAEAEPFINHYHLTPKVSDTKQTYFTNENINLLVTGQGAKNCEYALPKFIAHSPTNHWLNFGIAGSANFSIGTLVQANPQLNQFSTLCLPTSNIITVTSPEQDYNQRGVYDMEAEAVIRILKVNNTQQTLTIIKLISDGPNTPLTDINTTKQRFSQLIQNNTSAITAISDTILCDLLPH